MWPHCYFLKRDSLEAIFRVAGVQFCAIAATYITYPEPSRAQRLVDQKPVQLSPPSSSEHRAEAAAVPMGAGAPNLGSDVPEQGTGNPRALLDLGATLCNMVQNGAT